MRTFKNLTGLMFGAAIGMLIFLAMTLPAKSVEPAKQQIPIVTAYQDGKARASITLDIADNMADCIAELKTFLAENHPKPGVVLLTGCIEAPPVPIAAHQNDTTA